MKRIDTMSKQEIVRFCGEIIGDDCADCVLSYRCSGCGNCYEMINAYLQEEIPAEHRYQQYSSMVDAYADFQKYCIGMDCRECKYRGEIRPAMCFAHWLDEEVQKNDDTAGD